MRTQRLASCPDCSIAVATLSRNMKKVRCDSCRLLRERIQAREARIRRREELRAYSQNYRLINLQKFLERERLARIRLRATKPDYSKEFNRRRYKCPEIRERILERNKAWRAANPAKVKAYNSKLKERAIYAATLAKKRERYRIDPDYRATILRRQKAWRLANRKKVSDMKKRYRATNADRLAERRNQWMKTNRNQYLAMRQAKRRMTKEEVHLQFQLSLLERMQNERTRQNGHAAPSR